MPAQFTEGFDDLDFTNNPVWNGDQGKFIVNADTQLQLNNAAITDAAILYTQVDLRDSATWEFYYRMDFDPSGSNYMKIFLSANITPNQPDYEGYFLQTGESGDDDAIELYRKTSSGEELMLRGTDGLFGKETEGMLKVSVTNGEWEVWVDTTMDGNYESQGTANGYPLELGRFFGIACHHTSTRADRFYFDDFFIEPLYQDTKIPEVTNVNALSDSTVEVEFSEPMDTLSTLDPANYQFINVNVQVANVSQDPKQITSFELAVSPKLQNKTTYTLEIANVADKAGNAITSVQKMFTFFIPGAGDLMITEIFPDPSPPVQLPESEFAEIYNASDFDIDLAGTQLADTRDTVSIPSYSLASGDYLILCDEDYVADFTGYGQVLGISGFPTLNNGEDELTIFNTNEKVMDKVAYTSDFYRDEDKADGGWTLERIFSAVCEGEAAWIASYNAKGGTPGMENSTLNNFIDTTAPFISTIEISGQRDSLTIQFSEPLARFPDTVEIAGVGAASTVYPTNGKTIEAALGFQLDQGQHYKVIIISATDCYGNRAVLTDTIIDPYLPAKSDLVINEMLFNPASGGSDYVELYNRSDKVLSLEGLQWVEWDPVSEEVDDLATIEKLPVLMEPGQYFVFTEDPDNIKRNYTVKNPGWLFELNGLPNWPDDNGIVTLARDTFTTFDSLAYSAGWHYELISDENGVSLERISTDGTTNDAGNWFSAAETSGYGTPTYQNSQYFAEPKLEGQIAVTPEVFSPNQDGYNDQVTITMAFEEPGYTATIQVFDAKGRFVTELENNLLLSSETKVRWDGITNEGEKASGGIYVFYFKIFKTTGETFVEKRKCVLAERR